MQPAGRAAELAGDARPSLGGVDELLGELYPSLQVSNALLPFGRLSVGVKALAPGLASR